MAVSGLIFVGAFSLIFLFWVIFVAHGHLANRVVRFLDNRLARIRGTKR